MRLLRPVLVALALAAGCRDGTPIPDQDIGLRITVGADEVEFGKAFTLTVVRVWRKDLVPEEWSDRALAPLQVRLVETSRRDDGLRVEETRRFRCYAFSVEDITVSPPAFKARTQDGGAERVATAQGIKLRVRPALAREKPGPAELPGDPLPEPFPWVRWCVAGAAALVALALIARGLRRRARTPVALPMESLVTPHARAMDRLERLRERQPHGLAEIEAYYVEASALVREYIEEQFAVRAPEMTTEEFLGAAQTARALEASHGSLLAEFLLHCDGVKFARYTSSAPDREHLLGAAETFLRETTTANLSEMAVAGTPAESDGS